MRLAPTGKPAEGEGAWLERGLNHVHQHLFDLTPYAHRGVAGNPVQIVFDDLYTATRTALFTRNRAARCRYLMGLLIEARCWKASTDWPDCTAWPSKR